MNSNESEDKLAELLERWERAWEQGEDLSAEQLCAECPELVEALRLRIQMLKKMLRMTEDLDFAASEESAHAVDDPLISKVLGGRYRIDGFVAEGGFGRVYRAFDPELNRAVAIKVAKAAAVKPPELLLEEARRVARLRHPGIVPIHDVGRDGELWFFVSDLIEGQSLAELDRKLSPTEAAGIVAQVADALQHAHEMGFVHQDIKPSNILMDEQGRPQVTDFGIAVNKEEISDRNIPRSGTLPYMAPEQLIGEARLISPCTDVYALGVVLFELLTGRGPYQAQTPLDLKEQILFRAPISPRCIDAGIPQQLEEICLRCLAKHPVDRFSSAAELAAALRSIRKSRVRWWPWGSSLDSNVFRLRIAVDGEAVPAVTNPIKEIFGRALRRDGVDSRESEAYFTADLRTCTRRTSTSISRWWLVGIGIVLIAAIAAIWMMVPKQGQSPESTMNSPQGVNLAAEAGVFSFDGRNRIVTPLQSFAPCTLEVWIRTTGDKAEQYLVGSDVPNFYGIGVGIKNNAPIVETIRGGFKIFQPITPAAWTHLATVFGSDETVLFVNGKKAGVGPATEPPTRRSHFVIGNVGEEHDKLHFNGHIRSVRISRGKRYTADFKPDETFTADAATHPTPALLIYDGSKAGGDRVVDLSGNGNHGTVERLRQAAK